MTRLARWCFRHRVIVLLVWVVMLVLLVGITKKAGKDYTDGFSLPGTNSAQDAYFPAADGSSGRDTQLILPAGL